MITRILINDTFGSYLDVKVYGISLIDGCFVIIGNATVSVTCNNYFGRSDWMYRIIYFGALLLFNVCPNTATFLGLSFWFKGAVQFSVVFFLSLIQVTLCNFSGFASLESTSTTDTEMSNDELCGKWWIKLAKAAKNVAQISLKYVSLYWTLNQCSKTWVNCKTVN